MATQAPATPSETARDHIRILKSFPNQLRRKTGAEHHAIQSKSIESFLPLESFETIGNGACSGQSPAGNFSHRGGIFFDAASVHRRVRLQIGSWDSYFAREWADGRPEPIPKRARRR
ncbi:MAG: hypothetical protein OEQ29_00895 [Alphaproteobacteria bacterium]|nr:hypothetical protein [Alphaproteobacteria bacterium]